MKNKSPLYEQWLAAENKQEFILTLDIMAKDALINQSTYHYYRIKEYPPIEEFADAWVKNDTDALEVYRQKCLDVKEKYPKP